jgi:excisionase family DNA binding protein
VLRVGVHHVTSPSSTKRASRCDQSLNQLAYNVLEACQAARIGRTNLYEAIRSGELRAVKYGKRTLILADDLHRWLESLPAIATKTNP